MPELTFEDLACSTFALSGDEVRARTVHEQFTMVCNQIGARYNYGEGMNPQQLRAAREDMMNQLALIRDATAVLADDVYLCGGCMGEDIAPGHMWLQGGGVSYDKFINTPRVQKVNEVFIEGQPFGPGCEAGVFLPEQIVRIKVTGYTAGQVAHIPQADLRIRELLPDGRTYNLIRVERAAEPEPIAAQPGPIAAQPGPVAAQPGPVAAKPPSCGYQNLCEGLQNTLLGWSASIAGKIQDLCSGQNSNRPD